MTRCTLAALPVGAVAVAGLLWCMPTATAAPERDTTAATSAPTTTQPAAAASADSLLERMRRRRQEQLATQPASVASMNEADQIAAAETLMREHAPHMWKRLESLPDNGPFRNRLKRQMVDRGRDLLRIQQRDPEQFQREVEQVTLEDDVADLGRQLLGRGEPATDDTEMLRKKLRERISELVDVRIHNREARLARLKKTIETEEQKLEADRRNRDKLVDRQFNAVVRGRPFGGSESEGRPTLANPSGPRRGPHPASGPKAEVEAAPAPHSQTPDSDSDSK